MGRDRNTIATALSAEDLQEFVARCAREPRLTLARIQALAAERGITVSLMSARSFHDTTYARHLERLRRARELAERIGASAGEGTGDPGRTIADAAAAELSSQVFDLLVAAGEGATLDTDEALKLASALGRLRAGNVQVAALRQRIREYEEKRAALRETIAEAKRASGAQGGITRETLAEIERAAALL